MSNKADGLLASLRASIERRVREQLSRRSKDSPATDFQRIVDFLVEQERVTLERMIDQHKDNHKVIDTLEALIEWLPELARQLTSH